MKIKKLKVLSVSFVAALTLGIASCNNMQVSNSPTQIPSTQESGGVSPQPSLGPGTTQTPSVSETPVITPKPSTPENPNQEKCIVTVKILDKEESCEVSKGGLIEKLEDPVIDTGVFEGWYYESNPDMMFDFDAPINENTVIIAKVSLFEEGKVESYGYTEGLYATFKESNVSKCEAYVRGQDKKLVPVDKELIRTVSNEEARVDVLGLKAGNYQLVIKNSENKYFISNEVAVKEDDRSGYAHFGVQSGVGAYNNDGTLKEGAIVVYVTNENKNTVEATVNGKKCVGLVEIIQNATNAEEALDIRVLGNINTAQWNKIAYGKGNTQARQEAIEASFNYEKNKDKFNTTISSSADRLYEKEIIELGINSMSDDEAKGIVKLNGLTNYVSRKKTSSKVSWSSNPIYEYDSYYNMLDVMGGANITIEGIGTDASFTQFGLVFKQSNSIEVKNISFDKYTEDGIGFEGKSDTELDYGNYWIHNCEFKVGLNNWDVCPENDKDDGDGSTDFKRCHNITVSYSLYNGCHKTNLIGSGDSVKQYNITLHHNYYYKCSQRLPLVRQSNIHMYNNYYYGSTGYSNSIRANCYAFVEGCYYEGGKNPYEIQSNAVMKSFANVYDGVSISSSSFKSGNTAEYREQSFASNCKPDGTDKSYANFDTNKELFYYNDVLKRSDVKYLTDAQTAKFDCIAYAGCLKDSNSSFKKISYELNGGSLSSNIDYTKVSEGQKVKLPQAEKENAKFTGWYTDETLTQLFDENTPITQDITLYAGFEEAVVVTLVLNGGSIAKDRVTIAKGDKLSIDNPTKKGMDFVGWYLDEALTQAFDASSAISESTTLYAKWEEGKATLYDFSMIAKATYTQDFTRKEYGYVVKCTPEKPISISKFSKALVYDGISFPRGICTQGSGNENYRSVEFTITEPKKITIYHYTQNTGSPRSACIYGPGMKYNVSTGQFEEGFVKMAVGPESSEVNKPAKFEYYINPGTYYIASDNGSIILLGYKLETVEEVKMNSSTVAFADDSKVYKQFMVENGSTVSAIEAPTRAGHTFIGWYLNGEPFNFETPITSNTVIEAKYEVLNVINVEFDTNNVIKQFDLGTEFSSTGISCKVIYSDNSEETVNIDKITIDSSTYNKDVLGEYEINLSYLGFTQKYAVNVVNHVISIEVSDVFLSTIVVGTEEPILEEIVVNANTTTGVEVCTNDCTITKTEENNVITVLVTYNKLEKMTTSYKVYRLEAMDRENPYVVVDKAYTGLPGQKVEGKYTFASLSQASDYVTRSNLDVTTVIYLKKGVYEEKVRITHPNVHLIGEGYNDTIVTYGNASGTMKPDQSGTWGTSGSASVLISDTATGFYAEGISFRNSFDYIHDNTVDAKQAVALYCQADEAVFNKCHFFGYQDTLEVKGGRQLFYDCLVEGSVDYIFGYYSTTVFANCEIRSIYRGQQGGYIAAFQGCDGTVGEKTTKYGCVFANCNITAGEGVNNSTFSLARPWRQDSTVTYIGCEIGAHIRKNGSESSGRYVSMSGNSAANAHFYEYGNYGEGAITEAVLGVTMLTKDQALEYTIDNLFGKNQNGVVYSEDWNGSVTKITSSSKESVKLWNGIDLTKADSETNNPSQSNPGTSEVQGYTASIGYEELFNKYSQDGKTNNLSAPVVEGKFTFSAGVAIKSSCISNNTRESIYNDADPSKNQAVIIFEVEEGLTGNINITMNSSGRNLYLYKVENGQLVLLKTSQKTFNIDITSGKYVIGFENGIEPKITQIKLVTK